MSTEVRQSAFEEFLAKPITKEEIAEQKQRLVTAAFISHLNVLGTHCNQDINYRSGNTTLSIVRFFAKYLQSPNPVHEIALGMVPEFTYSPGYADTTEVSVNRAGYYGVTEAAKLTPLSAAASGKATEWIMGRELKLSTNPIREWEADGIANVLASDFNERSVAALPDHAELVRTHGYKTFFDYLLDVKGNLDDRVDTLFTHGIQNDGRLF